MEWTFQHVSVWLRKDSCTTGDYLLQTDQMEEKAVNLVWHKLQIWLKKVPEKLYGVLFKVHQIFLERYPVPI